MRRTEGGEVAVRVLIGLISLVALAVACGAPTALPSPTPNIQATVEAAVQDALAAIQTPTFAASATSTPDPLASTPDLTVDQLVVRAVPVGIPEYSRSQWSHWIDEDGDCQNTRHEVLVEESLEPVGFKSSVGCQVASGRWVAPFTGTVVVVASALDVDHMVPLKNAHLSGGWAWSRDKKQAFANDLSDADHLIAVTASANRSKGARGPEEWRPTDSSYWCEYATDWVRIKVAWELTATAAEWGALQGMLVTCEVVPQVVTVVSTPASAPPPTLTASPTLTPTPTPISTPNPTPTPTSTLESASSSFSMGLPFEKGSPPDGIMPMGETVNHSNPRGHPGLDFQWAGNPTIVAVAPGEIVDLVAHQHSHTKVNGYFLSVITGKYIVNYTQLGDVNPVLKPGDTVEMGDFLGHPSSVQLGHNTRMIHWDFGTYDIFDRPYTTPEGLSLKTRTNRLCPLKFFEPQSLSFLEEIWKDAWWEHRKRFPLLCNPPWDK